MIQFNDMDKAKGDTVVDHEVQFIPANINHDGNEEVKSRHELSLIHNTNSNYY